MITWYGSATGGTALAPTTALTNGTVYYAAITPAGGCESLTRTPVTVTLTTTPAPTANAAQSFCPGATVADLEAEGTTISWYAAATGGTALTGTTTLVNGTTYHASITPQDGCESIARTPVTATILVTAAPAAAAEQTFCQGATIADLDAEGDAITWYSAATGGTILATTTVLTDGTIYYASATPTGGCESVARTAVTAEITTTAAPTVEESTQTFCNEAEINDLDADGGGEILWYAAEAGGMPLNEDSEVTSGTTYYAAQVIDGCESVGRTAVTAEITTTDMPEGDQMQDVEAGTADEATIADLELTATGTVTWYATAEDAEEGENPLGTDTQLVTGTTYYATQTIDGCESLGFAVTVTVTLGNGEFNTTAFRYYPNPVKDVLTVSYDRNIAAIEVYNIVGQQVIAKTVNLNEATVDLSQLSAGTYLVKVMGDSASKTIKIVKQ